MKRLAVITSCVDLPYRDIEVFLESLKMSGYSSDVVVFSRYWMPMPHYVRLMLGWDNSVQFFAKRWHYYRRVLSDYDYVLCADGKDVIFQKDPSTWMSQNGLHVTAETPVYEGGMSTIIDFEAVVSNSASTASGIEEPLGSLAGRGFNGQKKEPRLVNQRRDKNYIYIYDSKK